MQTVLAIVISYLFGSIPWALVIGKLFYGKDIRTEGSGNLGASNAGRVLGKKAAVAVTLLDAFKATISMYIASLLAPDAIILSGLACCFGHCFPIFAQFHGGKAVASSYGFMLGIVLLVTGNWFWGLVFPILCFFGILYIGKMVSVASILSILIEVATSFILGQPLVISISLAVLWLFVTYRHKSNIQRVMNHTENKVKWMG